ncbi:amidase [Brevibacterium daeguense]|uniref:Amidase n=1 Tax=Brevibacterium daeguense TaxID=909936 RepID=A0ABP8EK17_9MICO|nr:amidase [Brevibacterium daeguense]
MSILDLSLSELAAQIKAREISPVDVTEASLARIAEVDPHVTAFVTVTADLARQQAAQAADEIAAGRYRGPLHGIPYAAKDLYDTAGIRTTSSSQVRADHIPATDAAAVSQLREAGMILVGKTETHEFAYGALTPQAGNPWDPSRTPGGSSGGSGAAVAAGAVHVALGTDTGGSIRIPAAVCGTVGLKPTYGRTSRFGIAPLSWALDHAGPLTRNVIDSALVLDAMTGYDRRDPASVDLARAGHEAGSLAEAAGASGAGAGASVAGLRVGVPRNFFTENVQPEVLQAHQATLELLAGLGAELVEVEIPYADAIIPTEWAILIAEASAYHLQTMRERPELFTEEVRTFNEAGELIPAVDYITAQRMRTLMQDAWREMFESIDVLVAPTVAATAFERSNPRVTWADGSTEEGTPAYVRLSAPGNLTGLPVLQVPNSFTADGLPTGVQIIGRPFAESTILTVGLVLEANTDVVGRTAPVLDADAQPVAGQEGRL